MRFGTSKITLTHSTLSESSVALQVSPVNPNQQNTSEPPDKIFKPSFSKSLNQRRTIENKMTPNSKVRSIFTAFFATVFRVRPP